MNYTVDTFYDAINDNTIDIDTARDISNDNNVNPLILIMSKNLIVEHMATINIAEAESLLSDNFKTIIPLFNTYLDTDNSLHLFLFIWCQSLRIQLMYMQPKIYPTSTIIEACVQLETFTNITHSRKALSFILISMHIHAMCLEQSRLHEEACVQYIKLLDKATVSNMQDWFDLTRDSIITNAIFAFKHFVLTEAKSKRAKEYLNIINKYLRLMPLNTTVYDKYVRSITRISTYNFFKPMFNSNELELVRTLCTVNSLPIDLMLLQQLKNYQ